MIERALLCLNGDKLNLYEGYVLRAANPYPKKNLYLFDKETAEEIMNDYYWKWTYDESIDAFGYLDSRTNTWKWYEGKRFGIPHTRPAETIKLYHIFDEDIDNSSTWSIYKIGGHYLSEQTRK